jgi:hypothetical protein
LWHRNWGKSGIGFLFLGPPFSVGHGTVEITPTTHFPNFPKEAIRFKCNQHKVKGMQINYKSAEKYVGDDAFDLLVLFPAGTAWEVHYDVSVR